MDRPSRLRRNEDFQRARREGRSWASPWVVLVAAANDLDHTRFGFAVGKKIGRAVVRNRVKRRLREVVRLHRQTIPPGWDIILIARTALQDVSFEQLDRAVTQLLGRARLLQVREDKPSHEGSRPRAD